MHEGELFTSYVNGWMESETVRGLDGRKPKLNGIKRYIVKEKINNLR